MQINVGFAGLLTICFIVLQLCGVIDWPWYWLIAPLWLGMAVWLGIVLFIALFAGLCAAFVGICNLFTKRR